MVRTILPNGTRVCRACADRNPAEWTPEFLWPPSQEGDMPSPGFGNRFLRALGSAPLRRGMVAGHMPWNKDARVKHGRSGNHAR
ncbi:MAG: hypothetical protein OXC82_09820 [Rhodobacteraceae bacterium]|nr:hypothetical protein [Paracoccaceae bacterium]MCY4250713.1 hypothetical protein [Paracoccaceae bacterium]